MNPQQEDRVAVWIDCPYDPPESEAEVMFVLAKITGDWLKAYKLVCAGKDVIAKSVTRDAAEVIVNWLDSVGAKAFIDDDYFAPTLTSPSLRKRMNPSLPLSLLPPLGHARANRRLSAWTRGTQRQCLDGVFVCHRNEVEQGTIARSSPHDNSAFATHDVPYKRPNKKGEHLTVLPIPTSPRYRGVIRPAERSSQGGRALAASTLKTGPICFYKGGMIR